MEMRLTGTGFWFVGAKLPLYAFKKLNNIESEKDLLGIENKEPPVAFLDSLVLGEVNFAIKLVVNNIKMIVMVNTYCVYKL